MVHRLRELVRGVRILRMQGSRNPIAHAFIKLHLVTSFITQPTTPACRASVTTSAPTTGTAAMTTTSSATGAVRQIHPAWTDALMRVRNEIFGPLMAWFCGCRICFNIFVYTLNVHTSISFSGLHSKLFQAWTRASPASATLLAWNTATAATTTKRSATAEAEKEVKRTQNEAINEE